jgi:hypothetical protein
LLESSLQAEWIILQFYDGRNMARGWESKSVESQMESAQSEKKGAPKRLTPEAAAAQRKKETLLLAHARLQQQMRADLHPRHLEMLQNALADLEKKLAKFGGGGNSGSQS